MDDNRCPAFTEKVRVVMRKRRITYKELADKTGMEYQHMYRLLNDRMPLYLNDAVRVATAIGTSIDRMLGFVYEEETK